VNSSSKKDLNSKSHFLYLVFACITLIWSIRSILSGEIRFRTIHFKMEDEPLYFWSLVSVVVVVGLYGFYLFWKRKSFYE